MIETLELAIEGEYRAILHDPARNQVFGPVFKSAAEAELFLTFCRHQCQSPDPRALYAKGHTIDGVLRRMRAVQNRCTLCAGDEVQTNGELNWCLDCQTDFETENE